MPVAVTFDIDRDGQRCDMARSGLDHHAKGGGVAAETLRPEAEGVDASEQIFFEAGIKRIGVSAADGAKQSLFTQQATQLKVTADAHADDERWTGICTGLANNIDDPIDNLARFRRRIEHAKLTFVFTAGTFEHDGELQSVAWDDCVVDDRGCV